MGEAWLARTSEPINGETRVVVKRLRAELVGDGALVRMLFREARVAAGLSHPNIVRVLDFASDGDTPFLVMEYVDGPNLAQLLLELESRCEKLELGAALQMVVKLAAALHHAHEARSPEGAPLGLVHRDVTPNNVLLTPHGQVKLTDFGIAKVISDSTSTRQGVRKGTVAYMSPEQCLAEPIDRRSDVFALGILLYEVTTMRRLFDGENEFVVLNQIVQGRYRAPEDVVPGYSKALGAVVKRALSVDPAGRYGTALEFERALVEFAEHARISLTAGLSLWSGQSLDAALRPRAAQRPIRGEARRVFEALLHAVRRATGRDVRGDGS
jgi:serine/threonine-protein kinase